MAAGSDKEKDDRPGLTTPHVFLDAQVYRGIAHHLASAPFRALANLIEEDRVTLHTTDITLEEASRHIADEVAAIEREAGELRRKRAHWARRFPGAMMAKIAEEDVGTLSNSAKLSFHSTIQYKWKARTHKATKCDPRVIFDRYFARKPPFEGTNAKEFPDAFVVEALASWCKKNGTTMYVVTADVAMGKAAKETGVLIPIAGLQDLLVLATEAETPELTAAIEKIIKTMEFIKPLQDNIEANIGSLGTLYSGDHIDGEILDVEVCNEVKISRFSIISASADLVGTIFTLEIPLSVTFQYIDDDRAWHNTRGWDYGEKEVEVFEDAATIRIYIEFDRPTMEILDTTILTTNVYLSEPYETYK